jgi:serine/threonine-protein kinase HipA
VVAGKLTAEGGQLIFNYGKSYLARENAISIYHPELPLGPGVLPLPDGMHMPSCIRDASPDAWGRRVLINKKFGLKGAKVNSARLDELTYLLESGSDRIGALDFQRSPTEYEPRTAVNATLEELMQSAERVEQGVPLTPELDQALHYGGSIGGARPKALIEDGGKKYIAKFSSSTDLYSVVKAEYIAMRLAALAGLDVASVTLTKSSQKDVLLIERFDRIHTDAGWQRKAMVSSLTLFALDEMMARYASYEEFAEIIRYRFVDAPITLKEMFSRLVFNILSGNTDDHARNHAAFWDGEMLKLTPAYDICPQGRTGKEASQAMLISSDNRMSRIAACLETAAHFLLSRTEAIAIVNEQLSCIVENWEAVCDEAKLSETDRRLMWGRQFLNPYALENLTGDVRDLKDAVEQARSTFGV